MTRPCCPRLISPQETETFWIDQLTVETEMTSMNRTSNKKTGRLLSSLKSLNLDHILGGMKSKWKITQWRRSKLTIKTSYLQTKISLNCQVGQRATTQRNTSKPSHKPLWRFLLLRTNREVFPPLLLTKSSRPLNLNNKFLKWQFWNQRRHWPSTVTRLALLNKLLWSKMMNMKTQKNIRKVR